MRTFLSYRVWKPLVTISFFMVVFGLCKLSDIFLRFSIGNSAFSSTPFSRWRRMEALSDSTRLCLFIIWLQRSRLISTGILGCHEKEKKAKTCFTPFNKLLCLHHSKLWIYQLKICLFHLPMFVFHLLSYNGTNVV